MHTRNSQVPSLSKLLMISAVALVFQPVHSATPDQPTVFHVEGKNRVHVDGCRRLTNDPAERAKLAKMTLAEAKAKGLELCSRCPGSTTPGRDEAVVTPPTKPAPPTKPTQPTPPKEDKEKKDSTVYQETGKNRVHLDGCRRLTKDPAERAKLIKMTLAEAKAKGLELCSRCPGSTTPGRGNPEKGDGNLQSTD